MAITIPSRHIYDTPQNNKVKNNLIDHIVVNAKTVGQATDENYNIYNGSLAIDNSYTYSIGKKNYSFDYKYVRYFETGSGVKINGLTCCYSEIRCVEVTRYKNSSNQSYFTVEIPKSFNGEYVADLNKKGINIKFRGNLRTEYFYSDSLSANILYEGSGETETKPYLVLSHITDYGMIWRIGEDTTESATYSFPTSIETTKQEDYVGDEGSVISTSSYTMHKDDIGDISIDSTNNDRYVITFTNTGIAFKSMSIYGSYKQGNDILSVGSTVTIPLIREDKTYTALEAVIEINGKVIKIDLSDSKVDAPSSSGDNTFAVESKEMLQTSNLYNSASAIQTLFIDTYNHYKNGKETATVLCDIAEYYENNNLKISPEWHETEQGIINIGYPIDREISFSINTEKEEDIKIFYVYMYSYIPNNGGRRIDYTQNAEAIIKKGELIVLASPPIEPNPDSSIYTFGLLEVVEYKSYYDYAMTFRQYDEVIPMVFGADGKDRPLSKDKNGNAKVFVVLGTKIYYDGAVWQELTLQEK